MNQPHILFRNDLDQEQLLFSDPLEIIVAYTDDEVDDAFARLEKARQAGKWVAGYAAYEAGYSFEEKIRPAMTPYRGTPLMCFGVFNGISDDTCPSPTAPSTNSSFFSNFKPAWDFETYRDKFDRLRDHIAKGDCYQGNLTFPIDFEWEGDTEQIFNYLINRQPVRYGAHIALCEPVIVSRSPELFFKVDKEGWIETHPMKGTAPRRDHAHADYLEIEKLRNDPKTRAENIMIVDLLRNDISRITETGTMGVPKLFEVETYPSVHQMVSHVRGKLLDGATVGDIFAALFPCGSITGAPKLRAMEILHDLEQQPRGIYCGAIGYIGPENQMQFNVAIRTLALFNDGTARINVGGGIVWDSEAQSEYEEALVKAKFLMGA